jgi:flavin-dependent dehydrogenase
MRVILAMLALLSVSHLLPSPARPAEQEYDVVIYGGTSAGVSAAVQAVRMGRSVILLEPGKHLGGMTSGGLGATDIGNKGAIGGIAREFYQRVRKHYGNDANWKYELRADFRGPGHGP